MVAPVPVCKRLPSWLGWTALVRPVGLETLWPPWGPASASVVRRPRASPRAGGAAADGLPLSSRKRNEPSSVGGQLPVCCLRPLARRGPGGVGGHSDVRCPLTRVPLSAQCGSVGSLLNDCFIVMWHYPTPGGVSVKASLRGGARVGLQSWPPLSARTLFGSILGSLGGFPHVLLV